MKFFRSHITKAVGSLILSIGILFYFIKPTADQTQHAEFAYWLQSNLNSSENPELISQIKKLGEVNESFESVVKQASEIVGSNTDSFSYTFEKEQQVYSVLLDKWIDFKTSANGMGKGVFLKQAKPNTVLPTDGFSSLSKLINPSIKFLIGSSHSVNHIPLSVIDHKLTPLVSGISINAP